MASSSGRISLRMVSSGVASSGARLVWGPPLVLCAEETARRYMTGRFLAASVSGNAGRLTFPFP
jgi:hypothetical protein